MTQNKLSHKFLLTTRAVKARKLRKDKIIYGVSNSSIAFFLLANIRSLSSEYLVKHTTIPICPPRLHSNPHSSFTRLKASRFLRILSASNCGQFIMHPPIMHSCFTSPLHFTKPEIPAIHSFEIRALVARKKYTVFLI